MRPGGPVYRSQDHYSSIVTDVLTLMLQIILLAGSPLPPGRSLHRWYVAVFNLGESPATLEVSWNEPGIPGERWTLRDLWRGEDLGADLGLRLSLSPHASGLFRLSAPDRRRHHGPQRPGPDGLSGVGRGAAEGAVTAS